MRSWTMQWMSIWRDSVTEIHVTLEKDGSATVVDNGRGVPVGMHEKGMSAAQTGVHDTACGR